LKSLIALWSELARECASRCHTSATQDIKTVLCRSECEGESFLTITLPDFGKSFERSLDQGRVDPSSFQGFAYRKVRNSGKVKGLPLFLGGFLGRIFDRASGELLDEPCVEAIRSVRQLTLMFGKMLSPCSDARTKAAFDAYIQCESEIRVSDAELSEADASDFKRISSLLFRSIFTEVDREIYYGRMVPKHGPGSTADKLRGNAKYLQRVWTHRLETYFPAGEYLLPNWRYYDQLDDVDFREPGEETPARVVSVPKTHRTPRIIAMEPTAAQYAQQAVLATFLDALGRDTRAARIIGSDDQRPNQSLAHRGSLYGDLATLDLSEASDRVSYQHVRLLLSDHPHFLGAVDGSRSRKADVPGHGVQRLAKFASMGSALCFPFEAMVFATIIFIGIERELSSPLTSRTLSEFVGKVRVYGDDIIVPVDYVSSVVGSLTRFGVKVNTRKSFWNGKFRESCGKEYYGGEDVSIVRVRRKFPTRRTDVPEVISIVSLRNQLYKHGYWQTVRWLDERISGMIKHFPTVLESSPVLGRHSFLGFSSEKLGDRLHNPLVKGYVVRSRSPQDPLSGPGALVKYFLTAERKRREEEERRRTEPFYRPLSHLPTVVNEDHLTRSGRAEAVDIKLGWYSAV
jgi:hypothetical protein